MTDVIHNIVESFQVISGESSHAIVDNGDWWTSQMGTTFGEKSSVFSERSRAASERFATRFGLFQSLPFNQTPEIYEIYMEHYGTWFQ